MRCDQQTVCLAEHTPQGQVKHARAISNAHTQSHGAVVLLAIERRHLDHLALCIADHLPSTPQVRANVDVEGQHGRLDLSDRQQRAHLAGVLHTFDFGFDLDFDSSFFILAVGEV